MKNQLLNYLVSMYTKRAIYKIAKHVREKPEQIEASLASFVPAIMCAMATKAGAGATDAIFITRKAEEANKNRLKYAGRHIELQYQKMEDNEGFLIYIFGGNNEWKIVAENIGKQYGLALYSSIVLMQILAPVCLSNLGKTVTDYDMTLSQVISYLNAQKVTLQKADSNDGKPLLTVQDNVPYVNTAFDRGFRTQKTMVACMAAGLLVLFTLCGYYFGLA